MFIVLTFLPHKHLCDTMNRILSQIHTSILYNRSILYVVQQHSCVPNLFVQNVFTDCHDPNFPMIAFFTNKYVYICLSNAFVKLFWRHPVKFYSPVDRVVKSGTELTWNYSLDAGSDHDKVPCLCVNDGCQGLMLWLQGNTSASSSPPHI